MEAEKKRDTLLAGLDSIREKQISDVRMKARLQGFTGTVMSAYQKKMEKEAEVLAVDRAYQRKIGRRQVVGSVKMLQEMHQEKCLDEFNKKVATRSSILTAGKSSKGSGDKSKRSIMSRPASPKTTHHGCKKRKFD
jgi:hypothetical protein